MPKLKPSEVPLVLKSHKEVQGVFVGGCVARGDGSSFRAIAHSHCLKGDSYQGWICIRAARRLEEAQLLIHELSHILTRQGHTQKFFDKFVELGGDLNTDQAYKNRLISQERKAQRTTTA